MNAIIKKALRWGTTLKVQKWKDYTKKKNKVKIAMTSCKAVQDACDYLCSGKMLIVYFKDSLDPEFKVGDYIRLSSGESEKLKGWEFPINKIWWWKRYKPRKKIQLCK
jgi:hypothetical protein